jgi:hypothetical protein
VVGLNSRISSYKSFLAMSFSSSDAGRSVLTWLREMDETKMIRQFDQVLVPRFGIDILKSFASRATKHQHTIVHELVRQGKLDVLKHLVYTHGFDINVQRASDLCTPLHLAWWQGQPGIAKALLEMGADASIQNRYGEQAQVTAAIHKPLRAQLQGTASVKDVLKIVDEELPNFSSADTVTAYYRIAKLTSDYNAENSNWKTRSGVTDHRFDILCHACTRVLCDVNDSESGTLWATMLAALAMHPFEGVLQTLSDWLQTNQLPFETYEFTVLVKIAVFMVKITGGSLLWQQCYNPLGTELAKHVASMQATQLAAILWAFAKAGTTAQGAALVHRELFTAAAVHLESTALSITDPGTLSIISWSFAKLSELHAGAFTSLAEATVRNIADFQDHNVANTAWAFAKLGFSNRALFRSLFERADSTLYHDQYKHHVKMSRKFKLISWFQVHQAYTFCRHNCQESLAGLSRRLETDLQRISQLDRSEGLSQGSGLETLESLRELDALIMASGFDASADAFLQWPPTDSLEADEASSLAPDVAAQNADAAYSLLGNQVPSQVQISIAILKFSRSPQSFRNALLDGPELLACREAMQNSGYAVVLESGAKVFVRPECYNALLDKLRTEGIILYSSHVVVAEEFEPLLLLALSNLPSSAQVRMRARDEMPLSWDTFLSLRITRTFIQIEVPSSLFSRVPVHAQSV